MSSTVDKGGDDEDGDYFVPLVDQRVFGAGIKRKRIDFIPASDSSTSLPSTTPSPRPTDLGAKYLSIVLGGEQRERDNVSKDLGNDDNTTKATAQSQQQERICTVCKQPVSKMEEGGEANAAAAPHESSIAHQVCLEHSYQPSHLDRGRVGVKYLTAYGWDVDSRRGLGARQEGIRIPIKVNEKRDTAGLRETVDVEDQVREKTKTTVKKEDKVIRLDAKAVRKMDVEAKKRAERMRQSFYGPDLDQYLGPNS